jgi:tRNA pseudouridine13 synthase
MAREYFLNHSSIEFHFAQNNKDFVVDEVPLYEFSGDGEHLILKIRKRDLTTWEMISIIAKRLGIRDRDIGYAGMKDKNGMTMQHISVPRKLEAKLDNFDEKNISILSRTYHNNKIRLGHLKGNRFFIRLKKVNPTSASMISGAVEKIKEFGMPNFFGYQRFGSDGDNFEVGKKIVEEGLEMRDQSKKRLFVNAYQSHLFNEWLSERIKLSRLIEGFSIKELPKVFETLSLKFEYYEILKSQTHPFKLLIGDVMMHYPHGRAFILKNESQNESEISIETDNTETEKEVPKESNFNIELARFYKRDIVPSGILVGSRAMKSEKDASIYESPLWSFGEKLDGERRYAWIFPEDLSGKYREEEFWFELNFFLPRGSYATTLLEEIAKREII